MDSQGVKQAEWETPKPVNQRQRKGLETPDDTGDLVVGIITMHGIVDIIDQEVIKTHGIGILHLQGRTMSVFLKEIRPTLVKTI